MNTIKLTTLGGVRENGKNMYIAEINDSIFVLDAGLKYPENEQLGVDAPKTGARSDWQEVRKNQIRYDCHVRG